jgi:nitroimidazol reductase NimA-like FMN-containing flavoprotein (pyridoxamine 5'-phosphate oxidase superfamily)
MSEFEKTARTTLRRMPQRGSYDKELVFSILDEGLVCHVGFVFDDQPFVIPTAYGRIGEKLYVHGAAASRMLKALARAVPVCVTVTLVDGIVLARSAFHHSMNYRSVVILGKAEMVTEPIEKRAALDAVVNHMLAGRTGDARAPNDKELAATSVLGLALEEVSAKVRTGGPIDDEEDMAQNCWAGHVPLRLQALAPVPDPRLSSAIETPGLVSHYTRQRGAKIESM